MVNLTNHSENSQGYLFAFGKIIIDNALEKVIIRKDIFLSEANLIFGKSFYIILNIPMTIFRDPAYTEFLFCFL